MLLFRRPGVALALAAAAMVAVVPAAGTPLLLSASQSDSIAQQIDDQCVVPSGSDVRFPLEGSWQETVEGDTVTRVASGPSMEELRERVAEIDAEAAEIPGLSPVERTYVIGHSVTTDSGYGIPEIAMGLRTDSGDLAKVFVAYRDGAPGMVTQIDGDFGPGAWIPDDLGSLSEAGVGDELELAPIFEGSPLEDMLVPPGQGETIPGEDGPVTLYTEYEDGDAPTGVTIPVTGEYRTLNDSDLGTSHWCHLQDMLQFDAMPEGEWVPTVLVDEETFWRLGGQVEQRVGVILTYELAATPTVDDAREAAAGFAAMESALETGDTEVTTDLPRFVARADLVGESLRLPVAAVGAAAVLVGLSIVGGAALLWTRRRRIELTVLAGRGVSPAALGGKAALEAMPALLLGGVAGYLLCRYSMPVWAPSDLIAVTAPRDAAYMAAGVTAAALLTVAVVAARACRRLTEPARAHRNLSWLPWELVPAGAAVAAWTLMEPVTEVTAGEASDRVGVVSQLPSRVFVVPLLAAIAVAMLVARAARWYWNRPRRRDPRRFSGFLASRRIRRDRWASAVMLAAVAVPTALAGYAITASASAGATIDAQARSEIGSDVVVSFDEPQTVPPELAELGRVTEVTRIDGLTLQGTRVSALFVDSETFARTADTADLLADTDVTAALDGDTGSVPAVAGGSDRLQDGDGRITLPGAELDLTVSAVPDLPAKRGGMPVVLIDREHMPDELSRISGYQFWVRTDRPEAVKDLITTEFSDVEYRMLTAFERYQGTPKHSVTKAVEYLLWVSVLTAVVVVVGMLLQLESRSAANRRAFVMMRRMGLRSGVHRMALLREIGGLLVAGVVSGLVIAGLLVAVMRPDFDVDTFRNPGVVLDVPVESVGYLAAVTVVVTVAAAWFGHARIAAARPSEVLRETG